MLYQQMQRTQTCLRLKWLELLSPSYHPSRARPLWVGEGGWLALTRGTDGVLSSWLVLVLDHGIVTLCHSSVTMSTDILGAKVVDDDPGRREMHKGVGSLSCYDSNKPVYASPGCHFGGVRGYTLMTGLLALYLQRCMYGE